MGRNHSNLLRILVVVATVAIAFALMSVTASLRAGPFGRQLSHQATRRLAHEQTAARLRSPDPAEFIPSLAALETLDQPGLLPLWDAAIHNPIAGLREAAWNKYREIRPVLERKELVPQVVRVAGSGATVQQIADDAALEVTIWSESTDGAVVAAAPYLVEEVRTRGLEVTQLYDTVAEWQQARVRHDPLAESITPEYQRNDTRQMRVAVVDLTRSGSPQPGYSNWLGDGENILMKNESFLAYLDVFKLEDDSIQNYVEERYERRGYSLAGFFTPEEFSSEVGRYFPGKRFDAGRRGSRGGGVRLALADGAFHSYQETLNEFTALAQGHPDIARLVNLGTSYEGRQIFALKISLDPGNNDSNKPDVLVTGCHHAREWISVETPVYFANQLISGYATDDWIRHLVDNVEVWIVPIVNPDGLTYSQGSGNFDFTIERLWRKNRRPISGACSGGTGIDLNRNYGYQWRLPTDSPCPSYRDDTGGSDQVENETYRGLEPNSEPEVKALNALTGDPSHKFLARLDYHNFAELILYPWGYQSGLSPDDGTLSLLGQRMSDLVFASEHHRYVSQRAIFLYQTTGTSTDYAYGADRIPAAFTVELRPVCCDFPVAENEIAPINRESWAGARVVLGWAAGPPILRSVKAYQTEAGGSVTKLVYSARWIDSGGTRQKVIDLRFPRIEPGPIQVHLQFSKPMNTAELPVATLGHSPSFNELTFQPVSTDPWRKTIYESDTWVGEATIPQASDQTGDWQLLVSASDATPLQLDGRPNTVATYGIGSNQWNGYEDSGGAGGTGGADTEHLLPPTAGADDLVLRVGAPRGGERLAGGDVYEVAWTVPSDPRFVPAQQEIWLSTDAGFLFAPIVTGIGPTADKRLVVLPRTSTTRAIIRVFTRGLNTTFGDSEGTFTIGSDVGSGLALTLASSQLVEQGWTDQAAGIGTLSGPAKLLIDVTVTNRGSIPVANPFLRVAEITRNNILLSRVSNSLPGGGARQYLDAGSDGVLAPGRSLSVRLIVGLVKFKKFNLTVEAYGVAIGGQVNPSGPQSVWQGKPRTQ
jgi:hypothetical protein